MKRRHHGFRSVLGPDIEQFVAYKRSLGRRYEVEQKTLALFDDYLVMHQITIVSKVSAELIDQFLVSRPRPRPRSYNHLRCTLARLFGWMVGQGRLEHTPVQSRPRRGAYQRQPFIFDVDSARQLLDLARMLPNCGGTVERGKTYHAMFAVLYGLGLRIGEACRLQIKDVDFERRLLVIRETKFYKSRLVPFGPKLEALLKSHLDLNRRRHRSACCPDAPLFSLRGGRAINPCTVSQTFHHLLPRLPITVAPGTSPPRLHDLRHSFAVGALTRWYRSGADPQAHLLALATLMGHVDVNSTALYLTTTPTLLQEANRRFEAFCCPDAQGCFAAMTPPTLGQLVRSFFADHLTVQKGLRLGSVRSYRDTMRLFLAFVAKQTKQPLARLSVQDLSFERVLAFLKHLEQERGNHARTRNQRRAALNTFFTYLALRMPEIPATCQQVAAIPVKRTPLPATHYLEEAEMSALLHRLPRCGRHALRDRTLLLFLYNTGARVQEAVDLRIEHLDLRTPAKVHLHGKGDKWRMCPLWEETLKHLVELLAERHPPAAPTEPVFCARRNVALTRFGIYKIVRRHGATWDTTGAEPRRVTPHLFRHTAAVHLLESGVEVNVIRGWLGHVSLDTTNRYAELTLRAKEEALRACEPTCITSVAARTRAVWKDDKSLLDWLNAL